jgi:alkanesulfonate monooxygenase SsuD/methylene tetrahydromethanopterin reductase-like flavin-dependent oxidoreductase (luciferase family)
MRFGIEIVPFGDFADPRQVLQMAEAAEVAGWEGVWLWDHIMFPYGAGDPWVMLAAIAAKTRDLKLIPGVAVLPRYSPPTLARLLTGLDLLSEGRVVLGRDPERLKRNSPALVSRGARAGGGSCWTRAWM